MTTTTMNSAPAPADATEEDRLPRAAAADADDDADHADAASDDAEAVLRRRHRRRRVLAVAGLASLLLATVGTFDMYDKKALGTSFSFKKFTITTSSDSSSSNSSSSSSSDTESSRHRRTNRTNTTLLHESDQQQKGRHSRPPLRVPTSSPLPIGNTSAEDLDRGIDGTTTTTTTTTKPSSLPALASPWQMPNLCERHQIAEGAWVPEHLPQPPYLPQSNRTRCRPISMYSSKKGWDTFKWVPNDSVVPNNNASNSTESCHFTEWNSTMFCELARYATVTIVGDSLSWEHCMSLVSLLGVPAHHDYQDVSRLHNVNVGHAACNGLTRIVYRRDDDLSKVRDALFEDGSNIIPQVVVLNRGAHYANDTDFMEGVRSALDVVEEWLNRCDQMNVKCHFFWRTTVPGHIRCHTFMGPVNDVAAMEAHVANLSLYDDTTRGYHWQDFRRQNLLALEELQERSARLPHRVLDGYRINLLRPDGHLLPDCLHSCYPGKMDVYPQLLLHYLRADRAANDVQRLKAVFWEQHWNLNVTGVYDLRKPPPA